MSYVCFHTYFTCKIFSYSLVGTWMMGPILLFTVVHELFGELTDGASMKERWVGRVPVGDRT